MSIPLRDNTRTRTVTWQDPGASTRDTMAMSGLDYLSAIQAGKIPRPPMGLLVGYRLIEVKFGRAVYELEPAEFHYNTFATVHGGVVCTLMDTAMTSAILSTLPVGITCSTLEMKVNFVRPLTSRTGMVRAEGATIHVGSRIATADGKLLDNRGRLYAHAVTTCMILKACPGK